MNKLKCFLDGNALCIVKDDFVNLQESDAMFVELTQAQIETIKKLMNKIDPERKLNDSLGKYIQIVKIRNEGIFDAGYIASGILKTINKITDEDYLLELFPDPKYKSTTLNFYYLTPYKVSEMTLRVDENE